MCKTLHDDGALDVIARYM